MIRSQTTISARQRAAGHRGPSQKGLENRENRANSQRGCREAHAHHVVCDRLYRYLQRRIRRKHPAGNRRIFWAYHSVQRVLVSPLRALDCRAHRRSVGSKPLRSCARFEKIVTESADGVPPGRRVALCLRVRKFLRPVPRAGRGPSPNSCRVCPVATVGGPSACSRRRPAVTLTGLSSGAPSRLRSSSSVPRFPLPPRLREPVRRA